MTDSELLEAIKKVPWGEEVVGFDSAHLTNDEYELLERIREELENRSGEKKLIPCPICGNEKLNFSYETGRDDLAYWTVTCPYCGIRSSEVQGKLAAVRAWNSLRNQKCKIDIKHPSR